MCVYARAGIPEFWIVSLDDRAVEVHRDPEPSNGRYRSLVTAAHGSLSPAAIPDFTLQSTISAR